VSRSLAVGPLVAATLVLVLGGCGADDRPSSRSATAADVFLQGAADDGIEVDPACVEELAGELSEEDARAVVEAGPRGRPDDLSPAGAAVVGRLLACADRESLAQALVADLEALGSSVDDSCVREVLTGLDLSTILDRADGQDVLFEAVVPCAEERG
jgi:hypothetical protein